MDTHSGVEQRSAHRSHNPKVAGSIPAPATVSRGTKEPDPRVAGGRGDLPALPAGGRAAGICWWLDRAAEYRRFLTRWYAIRSTGSRPDLPDWFIDHDTIGKWERWHAEAIANIRQLRGAR